MTLLSNVKPLRTIESNFCGLLRKPELCLSKKKLWITRQNEGSLIKMYLQECSSFRKYFIPLEWGNALCIVMMLVDKLFKVPYLRNLYKIRAFFKIDNDWSDIIFKVIHPKHYKHLKKGSHPSHLGRQEMDLFLSGKSVKNIK